MRQTKRKPLWDELKLIAQRNYTMSMQRIGYNIHSEEFKRAYIEWNEEYDKYHPKPKRR